MGAADGQRTAARLSDRKRHWGERHSRGLRVAPEAFVRCQGRRCNSRPQFVGKLPSEAWHPLCLHLGPLLGELLGKLGTRRQVEGVGDPQV